MIKPSYKLVGIGSGYFAGFQYRAWKRIKGVELTAMCNRNMERALPIMKECGIERHYTDYREMLDAEQPDIVDIITPPDTHVEMIREAAERGIHIICQKPLAPNLEDAYEIREILNNASIRFMVHENWRFQPWYREMKSILDEGIIGLPHSIYFRSRMGDGWGEKAYIPRQPYFREYPRFLIYENGIHFIDTFRYLFGEVKEVYARISKLNPLIKGEDRAMLFLTHVNGVEATWDANRYNEPNYPEPRFTFGEALLEGSLGSVRLYSTGEITVQLLGEKESEHEYSFSKQEFSGDCVYLTQKHFMDSMMTGREFEPNIDDYLRSLEVQEAVYESARKNSVITMNPIANQ